MADSTCGTNFITKLFFIFHVCSVTSNNNMGIVGFYVSVELAVQEMSVTMERWCDKVAIVTGASRGIGRAIALKLASHNIKTVAIGRQMDQLKDLPKMFPNIIPRCCDITDEPSLRSLIKNIIKEVGDIHILINNAGITAYGVMAEQSSDSWRKLMETNVMALCVASQIIIAHMREKHISGQIININSISGHGIPCIGDPMMGIYPASKYAVTAITETLRQEMAHLGTNIKITSLSPGYVYTDIHQGGYTSNPYGLDVDDIAEGVEYVLSTKPNLLVKELTLKSVNERF